MTHNEYNNISCKLNQLISNCVYKKNIQSFLSNDQYGNTIWRLKIGNTKISLCIFDFKNIKPFSDIIIPIKIVNGNKGIYNGLETFKNDWCIRGYKDEVMSHLNKFLKRLTTNKSNTNHNKIFHMN